MQRQQNAQFNFSTLGDFDDKKKINKSQGHDITFYFLQQQQQKLRVKRKLCDPLLAKNKKIKTKYIYFPKFVYCPLDGILFLCLSGG